MAYSNVMRYTGTSGVDTASMVEAMMKVEGLKYDTLYKKNLSFQYKQEAYQSVGNKLIDIQKSSLDPLATGSLRKSSTFKSSKSTIKTSSGVESTAVSVKLGSSSKNFSSTVKVNSLATAETIKFSAKNVGVRSAGSATDLSKLETDANGDATFDVTLDGVTKSVKINVSDAEKTAGLTDAELQGRLNTALEEKFGTNYADKASFSVSGGTVTMNAQSGHTMKLTSSANVSALGFSTTAADLTTAKSSSTTVQEALGLTTGEFIVNGTSGSHKIDITDGMTIDAFMTEFNKGSDGKMSYSSVRGEYTITGTKTGAANSLSFSGTSGSFAGASVTAGKDASVTIDGATIDLESNSYTYDDGTVVTFNATTTEDLSITASEDTEHTKTAIKNFVGMFNSLLTAIYDQTRTTRPKSGSGGLYNPLTEEESSALSATEIEKWETNAKTGLLYKDQDLKSIETSLRQVASKSITLSDGSSFRLSDLGIKLDADYSKGGFLVIDEDKLNEVVGSKISIDNITEAFTNTKDGYSTLMNKELNSAVGTSGSLTQKVGLKSSPLFMTDNTMKNKITQNTYRLADLKDRLAKKEDRYYEMFSYMENSITNSNNQLSALGLA